MLIFITIERHVWQRENAVYIQKSKINIEMALHDRGKQHKRHTINIGAKTSSHINKNKNIII